jgi:hypothetical protein
MLGSKNASPFPTEAPQAKAPPLAKKSRSSDTISPQVMMGKSAAPPAKPSAGGSSISDFNDGVKK